MLKPVLNIVVILGALAFGFFSFQKKNEFQKLQDHRVELKKNTEDTDKRATRVEANLAEERIRLKKAQDDQTTLEQSLLTLQGSTAKTRRDIASADAEIKDQKAKFKDLDDAMQEVAKVLNDLGPGVTIETLPDKVRQVEEDRRQKQQKSEELVTLIDGATKKSEANQAENKRLDERKAERAHNVRLQASEVAITSVNNDWGFVVIGAGTSQGYTPQSVLIVKRDGHVIGKLKPSSIEARQTIAEIDYDSMPPGVALMPGDKVMFAEASTN